MKKIYHFDRYVIVISNERDNNVEGLRSECPGKDAFTNEIGKDKYTYIEIRGEGIKPSVKEYAFCNLINRIMKGEFKIVIDEVS